MKRFVAAMLLLVLAASFVTGLLLTRAEAACSNRCDPCTCHILKCCDGVCTDTGRRCIGFCPLIICE